MEKYKLKQVVSELIEDYNRLHGVEATARVIEIKDDSTVIVEFKGTFCYTCGVKDWIEDLAYLALSRGVDAKLVDYMEPDSENALDNTRIGVFKFNNIGKISRVQDEVFDHE
ncbi:MAG: hypothetical protein QXH78_04005 [Desulfurococcaceae archaeon]